MSHDLENVSSLRPDIRLPSVDIPVQAAFRSAPVGMAVTRLSDRTLIDVNQAFEQLLGCSRVEVVGRTIAEIGILDEAAVESLRTRLLEGAALSDLEVGIRTKSGETRLVRVGTEAVAIGESPHAVFCFVDVTAIRAAEASARLAEERLRAVADHASDVIVQIDARSVIRTVNRAVESVFGYRTGELVGQPLTVLMPSSVRERHTAGLARYLLTGERRIAWQGIELIGLRKDGTEFPIEVSFGEYVAEGETLFSGVIRDITNRKLAEAALARTRRQYEALVESVDGIVWEADAATFTFTFVSERAESILGYPAAEWVSDADFWPSHIHPEDRVRALAFCRACTGRKEDHTFEYRMIAKDGRIRWLRDIVTYVADGAERPLLRGIMVDITDGKRATLQIARLNRVHAVLSGISEAVVRVTSTEQLFEMACRLAVERGGFAMACVGRLVEGKTLTVVAHAGATPDTLAVVRRLLEQGPVPGCAQTAEALATGRLAVCNDIEHDPSAAGWRGAALVRGYRAMAALPLVVEGHVVGTFNLYAAEAGFFDEAERSLLEQVAADLAFYLEATRREVRRHEAELALRASDERFREIAETIQEVFWMTDAAREQLLYVSPAYETVWGRPRDTLADVSRSWADTIHPDDRARVLSAADRQPTGGYNEEYRIVRPTGDVRWIHDVAFPVRNAAGAVERIVGVAADVTDRKAAEAQLREVQKMESVGRLAAGLAHDFNNLLTIIIGIAEIALIDHAVPAAIRDHLATIKMAGERAAQITRQLLAFSRKQVLHPTVVDLNSLVREAEPLVRRLLDVDVDLVVTLAPNLEPVKVDAGQLHQVILNLVGNSRDAMPKGGRLTIRTGVSTVDGPGPSAHGLSPGRYAVLSVEDTGHGMDALTQQRMFEPFFTTKPPDKGTGLGLSTVHGIVKQSGGEVVVASAPGHGTTISLLLPVVEQSITARSPAGTTGPTRGHERILVVDDDAGVRTLTRRVLERAGYAVRTAASGTEALAALAEQQPPIDLVLTDVVMPGMGGRELAEAIWTDRPEIRVVFMTGYTEDAILRDGVGEHSLHLVSKPYTAAQLTSKIRAVLDV